MFKIAKLEKVENEKITINYVTQQNCSYESDKKVKEETFVNVNNFLDKNVNFKVGHFYN